MDGLEEYEVESVTRARVHDKKGKKITWKYYVKWKGYDWDESTWEPTDSFQGGSEHILETFWERVDAGGRDISDATAFKKGEELLISGPPGRKGLKRKASAIKIQESPSSKASPSSNGLTISAPPLATRKRRRVQVTAEDKLGHAKSKPKVSTTGSKSGGTYVKLPKRRRASSPGPRRAAPKRQPSAGDSQLDADGETDPDVVEVEDELMQVSAEDAEDNAKIEMQSPAAVGGSASGSKKIAFDDLEHFYSGNPIDIDQNIEEQVQQSEGRPRLQSQSPSAPPPDGAAPEPHVPASPAVSSSDPLFDPPPRLSEETLGNQKSHTLPAHRAREANPLVKLIDTTTREPTGKQSRITAKARLISSHSTDVPSVSGSNRDVAKRDRKPGPGRSSSGLITKNRSSLLTATKGTLKSVKGDFSSAVEERDQPDKIEGASVTGEGDKLLVTSWCDEDVMPDQCQQAVSNSQSGLPPSGEELLKLAGLQTDHEALPDYEDDPVAQQDVEAQESNVTTAPQELSGQSSVEVNDVASDPVADASVPEAAQKAPTPVTSNLPLPPTATSLADEAVKKNIELAKEQLFPSTQTSFNSFSTTQSSFQSTIFGPLYQGLTANHALVAKNKPSTTFKVILDDGAELPLVLKDCSEIKARIGDILIGNSSGSKVALFYSAEDALAMVGTFKNDGTARVVLDPSANIMQQERFATFLQRFESCHTLIAPVGKEVCVLYSSENSDIAEKLGPPGHLRGLPHTLLISHASIENQLAYVAAVMKATAL